MKKSEALRILALSEGASDEAIKAAHRKKVIENHPDKFAHDPKEYAAAEERTKEINEARDVLLSRKWEPEYVRRGPYQNPYAGSYNPYRGSPSAGGSSQQGYTPPQGNPFEDWPFGQGGNPWVWTSWEGVSSSDGNPFDPFGASPEPEKTAAEKKSEVGKNLREEGLIILVKILVFLFFLLMGIFPIGLFAYVVISVVYAVWKRFRGCLRPFILPLVVFLTPLLTFIMPRASMLTLGLVGACVLVLVLDVLRLKKLIQQYRSL